MSEMTDTLDALQRLYLETKKELAAMTHDRDLCHSDNARLSGDLAMARSDLAAMTAERDFSVALREADVFMRAAAKIHPSMVSGEVAQAQMQFIARCVAEPNPGQGLLDELAKLRAIVAKLAEKGK